MIITVLQLLDAEGTRYGPQSLPELLKLFTPGDLDATASDLRQVLASERRIQLEDYRRLHILISHLYHQCGAELDLSSALRDELNAALKASLPESFIVRDGDGDYELNEGR